MLRVKSSSVYLSLIFFLSVLFISSCGGGGGSSSQSSSTSSTSDTVAVTNQGIAQLGNLAGATVEIYEITDNGEFILQWTETTSEGNSLSEIGKFYTHAEQLNPDSFYLYKVKGGMDWDADDDGVIDDNPTENKGIIRLIAKGSSIKEVSGNLRVTVVSEAVFEKVAEYLVNFDKTQFETRLKQAIQDTIDDIDGDGVVDEKDMLLFDPVNK